MTMVVMPRPPVRRSELVALAGQGQEHVVQAGQPQPQLRDRDAGLVQPQAEPVQQARPAARHDQLAHGVGARQRTRSRLGDERGDAGEVLPVQRPHVQPLAADLCLERGRRAGGDHPTAVEHDEVVGELVGLLEVLGGEQHGDAVGDERAHRVPHLVPVARVEPGGRLVEEQHFGAADEADREIQPAPHTARVGAHPPPRGLGEAEALDQLGGPGPGDAPRQVEQAGDEHEVVDRPTARRRRRRTGR